MAEDERKLTPAEEKRKENFEKLCEEMKENRYQKTDLTVSVLKANVLAIVIMLPFVIIAVLIYRLANPSGSLHLSLIEYILLFLMLLFLTVIHEGIHGLTWGLFAKSHFKAINFGVIWSMLTPYCTCSEPLTKCQYIAGAAMPTLILAPVLGVVATIYGSFLFIILCAVMIIAGGGDFFIILKILLYKTKNKEVLYYDHPYECGVVVFEKMQTADEELVH